MNELVIPGRYNGPAGSGNGGYASGVFAAAAGYPDFPRSVVTLRLPPPLDTPLAVERGAEESRVLHGDAVIATVVPGADPIPAVPPVPVETAEECHARYQGHTYHPFPTCFVCGLGRPGHDGLALTPGPLPGRPREVACTWRPDPSLAASDGSLDPAFVWAALDCPGGWTEDLSLQTRVLGRLSVQVHSLPAIGERHVITASSTEPQGRKVFSRSSLYTGDGVLLAVAAATWIAVPHGDSPAA
ncbi:hypothetical protein [Actinocorallia populi]|uniref:hypothetical protein n=1 Tax=Actinocorallia populi TaxID=2079200 RepID=UPI000D095BA3|nr:hypothetical protein [Actinocorallia populi]